MRLIDADTMIEEIEKAAVRVGRHYQKRIDGKPYIDGCRELLVAVRELLLNSHPAYDLDGVLNHLEEELRMADEEKRRCAGQNSLQFDSAKGYANGIANAIDYVKSSVFPGKMKQNGGEESEID